VFSQIKGKGKITGMRMRSIYCLITAVILLLAQCSTGPSVAGGGDDFPNSFSALGKRVQNNIKSDWSIDTGMSSQLSQINTSFEIKNPLTKTLQKFQVSGCDSTWVRIVRNLLYISKRTCSDTSETVDTAVFRFSQTDTSLFYYSQKSISKRLPFKVDFSSYSDLDGDSILVGANVKTAKASVIYETKIPGGINHFIRTDIDAGSDLNFITAGDNKILYFSALTMLAADTLEYYEITDADQDGFVIGNTDSSFVDYLSLTKEKIGLVNKRVYARYVIFPSAASKNYPIRYSVSESGGGWLINAIIKTIHGDTDFYVGDTIDLVRTIELSPGDTLLSDTASIRAVRLKQSDASISHKLVGIHVHTTLKKGSEREFIFNFEPETPILDGAVPDSGTIQMKVIKDNSGIIDISGALSGSQLSVIITDSDGTRYAVIWDKDGNVLKATKLN
jgi:hypothetical protein